MEIDNRWIRWLKFNITIVKYFKLVNRAHANVSHLLYADDTLILCGAERSQIYNLHMNMLKSTIYLINEVLNLEEHIRGCNIGSFPSTYSSLTLYAQCHRGTQISSHQMKKITQPKYQGGFGIKNLTGHNKSNTLFRRIFQICSELLKITILLLLLIGNGTTDYDIIKLIFRKLICLNEDIKKEFIQSRKSINNCSLQTPR
ncbi:hypothetical protein H5410_045822 [Solanum commersonii]|uniref:Reverse transcriptase domain-containing protein n=1 Tax=Solanum commersonii TaxID=4109 RepID=A0A9J5XDV4_SOLCO|nr:hypothetical protein H5410_045822 [Solanum commersonii]